MNAFWITFLSIITAIESPKTPEMAARAERREGAIGVLQIRPIYLLDVNERCKKNVMAKYGRRLTMMDMRDEEKARWVANRYLTYWGKYYTKKMGNPVTTEVYARIHNGGPDGWRKNSTKPYLEKFRTECKVRGLNPEILRPLSNEGDAE